MVPLEGKNRGDPDPGSPSEHKAGMGKVINEKEEERVMELKMGKNLEAGESGIFKY